MPGATPAAAKGWKWGADHGCPCKLRGTFVTSPLFSSAEFQVKTNEDIFREAE